MKMLSKYYYGNFLSIAENIEGFAEAAPEEMNKALRSAISKCINEIGDIAERNLRAEVKGADDLLPEGGTLIQGIKRFTWKGKPTATIHIYGDQNKNDGTWRLRFFEGGTKERYHRTDPKTGKRLSKKSTKGHHTGHIEPTYFFSKAVTEGESKFNSIITETVQRKIEELTR